MNARGVVLDTYWKVASERQKIFFKKLRGEAPPYTLDPILSAYKFCNVYRASDRVSQFLIKDVIYSKNIGPEDTLFRIFLFRLLNKIETWVKLERVLGEINIKNFDFNKYSKALGNLRANGPIYGNAFILCANKAFGFSEKHKNHMALLEMVFGKEKRIKDIINVKSLEQLFNELKRLPLIGDFMAYQLAIDFNYSEVFGFSENDFVVAGPGAIRGINKCFIDARPADYTKLMYWMVANQDKEFARLGLDFKDLWGRPMHAIDCQGMFCELDKYSRVKFPDLKSNRIKIKAKYKPISNPIEFFYPPKWGIRSTIISYQYRSNC